MGKKVKISELDKAISEVLQEYAETCSEEVKGIVDEVAKETVADLRKGSPKKSGKYSKKWSQKVAKESGTERIRVIYVSKPDYRRTHLLERGHAKRNGGRTKAQVHIAPAEEAAIQKLEKRIRRKL